MDNFLPVIEVIISRNLFFPRGVKINDVELTEDMVNKYTPINCVNGKFLLRVCNHQQEPDKNTLLHKAVIEGNLPLIKDLIDRGADPGYDNGILISIAAERRLVHVVKYFQTLNINYAADHVLDLAIELEDIELMKRTFLQSQKFCNGNTLMHKAAMKNNLTMMVFLHVHGVEFDQGLLVLLKNKRFKELKELGYYPNY